MNDSYRNNNEVEYCSRVIYCFKTKNKFKNNPRFSQSQHTTPDPPCIIIIIRIYLKNDSIITPTLERRKPMRL